MPGATWQPWVPLNNFRGWPGKHTRQSRCLHCWPRFSADRGSTGDLLLFLPAAGPSGIHITLIGQTTAMKHGPGHAAVHISTRPGWSLPAYSSNWLADPEAPVSPVTNHGQVL